MKKKIFFDLDDTLLDFHRSEATALKQTMEQLGIKPTAQLLRRYSEINAGYWRMLEEKKVTRQALLSRRFEDLYQEFGLQHSGEETQKIYEEQLSRCHFFVPGAQPLLEYLSPLYDLYLVSNGSAKVQDRRIRDAEIGGYFKEIFISQRIGVDKPDRVFFDRCFAAIGDFCREDGLIVGDSLSSDILGGNRAGLLTCWFNPEQKPRQEGIQVDYEIQRLEQLPALLREIFPQ